MRFDGALIGILTRCEAQAACFCCVQGIWPLSGECMKVLNWMKHRAPSNAHYWLLFSSVGIPR